METIIKTIKDKITSLDQDIIYHSEAARKASIQRDNLQRELFELEKTTSSEYEGEPLRLAF